MNKTLFLAFTLFFLFLVESYGQSKPERENKAVFNRIEYFFNTQQSDSIYQLANDTFKQDVSSNDLKQILGYFYTQGRIQQVEVAGFTNNTALYQLRIGNKIVLVDLAIDSTFHYSLLKFRQVEQSVIKKEPVISKVAKANALDDQIDSLARSYIQQAHTQSLAVGIIHKNRPNMFFYGETAKGNKTLPTENSIYEIGSVTKTFTATLLAHFVQTGVIQLEDSISKFLPDSIASNPSVQKITFKSLANHTSGLPRIPANLNIAPKFTDHDPYAMYTRKDLFAFLKDFKSDTEPETNYEYSNLGFGLLGELLSIVAKKTYAQLVKELITDPLQMTYTMDKLNPKTQQLVTEYDDKGNEVKPWNFQALAGSGALKSTIKDLLTYLQIQFNMPTTPLENAMMQTRQFTYFIPPNTDIGLAWRMNMLDDIITYWHTGATAGTRAFVGVVPDKKAAIVVLSNANIPIDEVSKKMLEKIITIK